MDPTSFDDLTKALASSTSRSQVLKTIVATTLGSLLVPFTSCVLSTSHEPFL